MGSAPGGGGRSVVGGGEEEDAALLVVDERGARLLRPRSPEPRHGRRFGWLGDGGGSGGGVGEEAGQRESSLGPLTGGCSSGL